MKKVCKACKSAIDDKATKCPKCGSDQRGWFRRHPILTFLVVLFTLPFVISGFVQNQASINNKTSPTPEGISEEYKASLADSFCKNRSDGNRYFDLAPVARSFTGEKDDTKLIYNTTKKPLASDCRKVAEGCLKLWSKQECEDMAAKKIWIGMNELELNLSWGNPNDKNNTTGSWGIHTQWVYGNPIYGANYVYLEGKDSDSLKVTSWQN
jgi:hypothetical protein